MKITQLIKMLLARLRMPEMEVIEIQAGELIYLDYDGRIINIKKVNQE